MTRKRTRPDISALADRVAGIGRADEEQPAEAITPEPELTPAPELESEPAAESEPFPTREQTQQKKPERKKTSITLSPEAEQKLEDLRYHARQKGEKVTYSDLIEKAIALLAERDLPKPVEK